MRQVALLRGVVVLWVAVLATVSVDGCGSSPSKVEQSPPSPSSTTTEKFVYPKGPTRQFYIPGGDNAVQTFGREATSVERRQATTVISGWMRARAAKDWAKVCPFLSRVYLNEVIETGKWGTNGKAKGCPEGLAFIKSQTPGSYADNFGSGPVVSLRIEEGHGFAQYHGTDGKDWVVPVERDGGRWKVANFGPIDRNK